MLHLVATPIGENSELSPRALDILTKAEVIICESTKEASTLLRYFGVTGKTYEVLNEHTTAEDLKSLVPLCADKNVALVSDCGTPGFCDPGADLVKLCRRQGIQIRSALGPSALMGLLSLSSERLDEFVFRGFVPAETEARKKALKDLTKEKRAIVLMDTPYRLKKMVSDMKEHFAQRRMLLVLNLSQDSEAHLEGSADEISKRLPYDKAEFMLLLYPIK